MAEIYGYIGRFHFVIVTHLSEIIRRHIHELITRQDVNTLMENVKKVNPAIVEDVIPGIINLSDLQKIIVNLLKEGVPVRDMESILETIGEHGTTIKDTDMLTEYVRQRLRRTITRKYTDGSSIKVVTLDQEIENTILNSTKKSEYGTYLAIEPHIAQKIVEGVSEQVNKLKEIVSQPVVLTSPVIRIYFKRLIEQFIPNLTVLSFNEIDANIQIQSVGVIQVKE